jgi:hypothetical protein
MPLPASETRCGIPAHATSSKCDSASKHGGHQAQAQRLMKAGAALKSYTEMVRKKFQEALLILWCLKRELLKWQCCTKVLLVH